MKGLVYETSVLDPEEVSIRAMQKQTGCLLSGYLLKLQSSVCRRLVLFSDTLTVALI